jgi:hypothetical protein
MSAPLRKRRFSAKKAAGATVAKNDNRGPIFRNFQHPKGQKSWPKIVAVEPSYMGSTLRKRRVWPRPEDIRAMRL